MKKTMESQIVDWQANMSQAFQILTEESIQYHKPAKYRAKIPGYYDFPNFAIAS